MLQHHVPELIYRHRIHVHKLNGLIEDVCYISLCVFVWVWLYVCVRVRINPRVCVAGAETQRLQYRDHGGSGVIWPSVSSAQKGHQSSLCAQSAR